MIHAGGTRETWLQKALHLLSQRVRDKVQIKRPGITEFDPGILRPKVVEDFRYLDFRMRAARRKHGRGHGNVARSFLHEALHRLFQGRAQNSLYATANSTSPRFACS